MSTITLTFGDQAENHVGMQKIGQLAESGLSPADLRNAGMHFTALGYACEYVPLCITGVDAAPQHAEAAILIVRNGVMAVLNIVDAHVDVHVDADELFHEQQTLMPDKMARMYGRVVHKHARHNLCFADEAQPPNYAEGQGTIIAYSHVPLTNMLRQNLPRFFGPKATQLAAEGNYYFDVTTCGIGFHGDSERKIVIAARLGAMLPLHFQWFHHKAPIGHRLMFELRHGDMYAMSEKATGHDWKRSTIPTLRHAAGCAKFLQT